MNKPLWPIKTDGTYKQVGEFNIEEQIEWSEWMIQELQTIPCRRPMKLTKQQTAHILAALRFTMDDQLSHMEQFEGKDFGPLEHREIQELCEALKTDGPTPELQDYLVLDAKNLFVAFPGFLDDSDVNGADLVDYINDALHNQGFTGGE